jgi:hypothetical protein
MQNQAFAWDHVVQACMHTILNTRLFTDDLYYTCIERMHRAVGYVWLKRFYSRLLERPPYRGFIEMFQVAVDVPKLVRTIDRARAMATKKVLDCKNIPKDVWDRVLVYVFGYS